MTNFEIVENHVRQLCEDTKDLTSNDEFDGWWCSLRAIEYAKSLGDDTNAIALRADIVQAWQRVVENYRKQEELDQTP